jgi:hypothetical protein
MLDEAAITLGADAEKPSRVGSRCGGMSPEVCIRRAATISDRSGLDAVNSRGRIPDSAWMARTGDERAAAHGDTAPAVENVG